MVIQKQQLDFLHLSLFGIGLKRLAQSERVWGFIFVLYRLDIIEIRNGNDRDEMRNTVQQNNTIQEFVYK